jgi:hypothetical protein
MKTSAELLCGASMKIAFAVFGLFVAGCSHPWGPPPPEVPRGDNAVWEQYCTYMPASDIAAANRFLHNQGANGWEVVSVEYPTMYCFKKRIAQASQ